MKASFLAHDQGVGFSLVFDTGPMMGYPGWAMISAGKLLIGERESFDSFCPPEGRVAFFPALSHISTVHWVVWGSVTVEGPIVPMGFHTSLLIDTGAMS